MRRKGGRSCAYFYLRKGHALSSTFVLLSLVIQLCAQLLIPRCLAQEDAVSKLRSAADLNHLLAEALQELSQVVLSKDIAIVIDAWDSENMESPSEFGDVLRELCKSSFNVFVSSRTLETYLHKNEDDHTDFEIHVEPSADLQDLRSYAFNLLEHKLYRTAPARLVLAEDPEFKEQVVQKISEVSKGEYLRVRFHLVQVLRRATRSQIQATLDNLPQFFSEIVTQALTMVSEMPHDLGRYGKLSLLWLSENHAPIKLAAMQEALAFADQICEGKEAKLPQMDQFPAGSALVDCWNGLVDMDAATDTITLTHKYIHTQVRKLWKHGQSPDGGNRTLPNLTELCLRYLCLDELGSIDHTSEKEMNSLFTLHPFLSYAALNWGSHYREVLQPTRGSTVAHENDQAKLQDTVFQLLRKLFSSRKQLRFVAAAISWLRRPIHEDWSTILRTDGFETSDARLDSDWLLGAKVAVREAYLDAVNLYLGSLPHQRYLSTTAFWLELLHDARKMCVESNRDRDASLLPMRTAIFDRLYDYSCESYLLGYSVANGDLFPTPSSEVGNAVQSFFDTLHEIEKDESSYAKRFCEAVRNKDHIVISSLLCRCIDVNNSHVEEPMLHCAVLHENYFALRRLLAVGADPAKRDRDHGWTALHLAASRGNIEAARTLLSHGADINALDKRNRTALTLVIESTKNATSSGSALELAEYLIRSGIDIEVPEKRTGYRALHHAAAVGFEELVSLLLRHGADATATTDNEVPAWKVAKSKPIEELLRKRFQAVEAFSAKRSDTGSSTSTKSDIVAARKESLRPSKLSAEPQAID